MKSLFSAVIFAMVMQAGPGPGPTDFQLKSNIDWASQYGQYQVVTAGWQFECRSGLQVTSQRWGWFSIVMVNTATGQMFFPASNQIVTTNNRTDVAAAYTSACPSVGPDVGFEVYSSIPPPGTWQIHLVWGTQDGAGRYIQNDLYSQPVVVQ